MALDVDSRRLHLCSGDAVDASFSTSIGRAGTGKRREGDNKTPIGVYRLGRPRASRKYGTFIPVMYPTPAQRRAGFTGSAIGIHGPPSGLSRVAFLGMGLNWTRGCVAVADNREIEDIAAWVRAHPNATVEIDSFESRSCSEHPQANTSQSR